MDPDSKRTQRAGSALRVSVSDGRGRAVPDGGLARWLAGVAPARARGEVAIALVTDAHVRTLNQRYRRKDAPTDVLSFAADPGSLVPHPKSRVPSPESRVPNPESRVPNPGSRTADPGSRFLGDLVIATGVARRQARDAGHSYHTELRILALHGLLHLLGYDHHDRSDGGRMARVESRLRRHGGLREGLIERARTGAASASRR